jgi:DNA-binding PucR family transcriptional regulator
MGTRLTEMASALHSEMADAIPELRGDPMFLELLRASTESNIETFMHLAQHAIAIEEISPPAAAVAYAQRLAQRGTSSNALLRAYRLGQRRVVDLAFAEIARQEPDADVAYAAAQLMHRMAFNYVDQVSERVIAVYESERERWLANRNSVRASVLAAVLRGDQVDIATAESALSYRLRQHHLSAVVWNTDRDSPTTALRRLESVVAAIATSIGAAGQPLFIPQDRSLSWAWIPLGRTPSAMNLDAIQRQISITDDSVRVALGTVGAAISGFRTSHLEAVRAQNVATVAAGHAHVITAYGDPGVRAAALLTADLTIAQDLVMRALGPLAADSEAMSHLRETLLVFLSEGGSYRSASERLHVHRNTVKYRVDRAIKVRGRALDDDRLNLELALVGCRWLGKAVLSA